MLIIVHHLIMIIEKIIFLILGEGSTLELMEALVHKRKNLVLILLEQIQNFVWDCIIILT